MKIQITPTVSIEREDDVGFWTMKIEGDTRIHTFQGLELGCVWVPVNNLNDPDVQIALQYIKSINSLQQ